MLFKQSGGKNLKIHVGRGGGLNAYLDDSSTSSLKILTNLTFFIIFHILHIPKENPKSRRLCYHVRKPSDCECFFEKVFSNLIPPGNQKSWSCHYYRSTESRSPQTKPVSPIFPTRLKSLPIRTQIQHNPKIKVGILNAITMVENTEAKK